MKKQIQTIVLLTALLGISCSALAKPGRIAYLIPEGYTGGAIRAYIQRTAHQLVIKHDDTMLSQDSQRKHRRESSHSSA